MAEPDGEDTFKNRLRKLNDSLGFDGWEPMAAELRALTGFRTRANHMSGWQEPPGPALMLALAILHPADPRGCLKWLREGGEMPRLHVDRNERGSGVHQPGPNHARALEVVAAINRLAVEVGEILTGEDQQPDPDTKAAIAEGVKKVAAREAASPRAED